MSSVERTSYTKKVFAGIWMLVLLFVVFYYYKNGFTVEQLQSYIASQMNHAGLLFIIIYTIRPLIFFPTSIMTPLAAVLFGPYFGWLFAYIGEMLSATVAFFVGRYLGRSFVREKISGFLQHYDEKLTRNGFQTVLFLRLIPLFPFDFVNYASGLSGIMYKNYITATLLGVLPGLTAFIFLGTSLTKPVFIIPTIIIFFTISLIARYAYRKK